MSREKGFTLIELMLVIVIAGLMMMIGLPRLRDGMIRTDVRSARAAVTVLHAQARAAAVGRGRPSYLAFDGDNAMVLVRIAPGNGAWADTVGSVTDLNALYGVTVTASNDLIGFDPRGFGDNSESVTVEVAYGDITETVTIGAFGRLQ